MIRAEKMLTCFVTFPVIKDQRPTSYQSVTYKKIHGVFRLCASCQGCFWTFPDGGYSNCHVPYSPLSPVTGTMHKGGKHSTRRHGEWKRRSGLVGHWSPNRCSKISCSCSKARFLSKSPYIPTPRLTSFSYPPLWSTRTGVRAPCACRLPFVQVATMAGKR